MRSSHRRGTRRTTFAASAMRSRRRPCSRAWVIVDDGSTDGTAAVAAGARREHPWVVVHTLTDGAASDRPRDAHGFQQGLGALQGEPDVVVKLDADVSVEPDYFERLLGAFADDPRLGIASGTCFERDGDRWVSRNVTGSSVWGAARAYRRACLDDVLPLEARMGWDGVDETRANARGGTSGSPGCRSSITAPRAGARAPAARCARHRARPPGSWATRRSTSRCGRCTTLSASRPPSRWSGDTRDRRVRREPRSDDDAARAYLRKQQSVRNLWTRRREATRPPQTL